MTRHNPFPVAGILFLTAALLSCKKESKIVAGCFPVAETVRTIANKNAKISEENGVYYIVEEFAIDSKLKPCNLPDEFKIENLSIKITGEVMATLQNSICCINDFQILKISK